MHEWAVKQRQLYKENKLSLRKITLLKAIHFPFNALEDNWQAQYQALVAYQKKYPKARGLPKNTLGAWASLQRQSYAQGKLSQARIKRLNAIGFQWKIKVTPAWEQRFSELMAYKKQYGHCRVSQENPSLQAWLTAQRVAYRHHTLSKSRVQKLSQLGLNWDPGHDQWERRFNQLKNYYQGKPLKLEAFKSNRSLYGWAIYQRQKYRAGVLEPERLQRLKKIIILKSQRKLPHKKIK